MASIKKVKIEDHAHPIYYREGSSDVIIINQTFFNTGEYPFPVDLKPKCILDIGGNIGVIAIQLARLYPEAKIFSFEPVKENFDLLKRNTEGYKNISAFNFGLGDRTTKMKIYDSDDPTNFGGFSTHEEGVNKEKFQEIEIEYAHKFLTENNLAPDMIKIDAEGAEHSILTSMGLESVQRIYGELHGVKDFALLAHLESEGFKIGIQKNLNSRISFFQAEKLTEKI